MLYGCQSYANEVVIAYVTRVRLVLLAMSYHMILKAKGVRIIQYAASGGHYICIVSIEHVTRGHYVDCYNRASGGHCFRKKQGVSP